MSRDRAILHLAAGQTLAWAGIYYLFPALLVRWEQSFGWSRTELTAAITFAVFLSAVISPMTGRVIDRGDGPRMMAGCTLLGGCCLVALSGVSSLWQFYLVWAVLGAAMAGCLYEPCFALVTRARGAGAKQGIILITLMAGFASTISFPASHALAEAFGWRMTVLVFAAAVIAFAAPLMWRGASQVERDGAHERRRRRETEINRLYDPTQRRFWQTSQFWFLAVGFGLAALLHGVTLHHLLPIFYDRGIDPGAAIVAASFIGPMQVAGRLAMMAAARHLSNHGVAIGCFLLMAMSIVLLIAAGAAPVFVVGFVVLFGGAYGTVSIVRPLIARDVLGEENFGAKSGLLAMLYLTGSASAPYLGALAWTMGGYDLVLPGLVLLAILGLLLYLAAHRKAQRR